MDISFIFRNYLGLVVARFIEMSPARLLPVLRRSRGKLKPFIASRLRGERLTMRMTEAVGPVRMNLRLDDDVQRQIYLSLYEVEEIERCRHLVHPGGTCVDVGANVGWFTLHFAAWVGSTGRVIAIEADPDNVVELRANSSLNMFDQIVHFENVAISDRPGVKRFNRSARGHSGWGSVEPQDGNAGGEVIDVVAVTLDQIVEKHGVERADILKIDVEGHEFAVLEGAADSLARGVFQNVFIEWVGWAHAKHGRTLQQMLDIFTANHYTPTAETSDALSAIESGEKKAERTMINLLFSRTGRRSSVDQQNLPQCAHC